jgi:flagellar protein FlaG
LEVGLVLMSINRVSSSLPSDYKAFQSISFEKNRVPSETEVKEPPSNEKIANPSKEDLEGLTKAMNEFLQPSHTSLKFTLHEDSKEYYVKIIDDKTKEIIREIPSKKMMDMYAAMREFIGLIFDKKI